jgi:hypothetical protein
MFERLPPRIGARLIDIVAVGPVGRLAALPGPAAALWSCRLERECESLIAQARALVWG